MDHLLNLGVAGALTRTNYASGHGVEVSRSSMGLALLYYTLPLGLRARLCVCLGSGGGLVPSLMAQAQKDAGVIGSRTVLVDAVLPEAGFGGPEGAGGWFEPVSMMRRNYPEIWALTCRTDQAARDIFQRWKRPIDYLHIDADHSYEGVTSDFADYSALLHDHSIVTFHDSRMLGVQNALSKILKENPQFDVVNFPDVGQGLAILRPRLDRTTKVLVGNYMSEADLGEVAQERHAEPAPEEPALWSYLKHPALFARHAIAAQYLGRHQTVIEIGGYVTPVGPYLRHIPKNYILVDPLCEPPQSESPLGRRCTVSHLNIDLDAFDTSGLEPGNYGVVFLGAQIDTSTKSIAEATTTICKYFELLSNSKRAVLEFPPSWASCKQLFETMLSLLRPKIEFEVTLDLSQNEVLTEDGDAAPGDRLVRQMFVLSGFRPFVASAETLMHVARLMFGRDSGMLLDSSALIQLKQAVVEESWRAVERNALVRKEADGSLRLTSTSSRWGYTAAVNLASLENYTGPFRLEIEADQHGGSMYVTLASDDLSEIGNQQAIRYMSEGRYGAVLEGNTRDDKFTVLFRNGPGDSESTLSIRDMRLFVVAPESDQPAA